MRDKINIIVFYMLIISFCIMNEVIPEVGKISVVAANGKKASEKIVAFYFHGNYRCSNCRKIEQFSREGIEKFFSEELETEKLIFHIINIDLPENKHFISDYQLYTRSLIIAEFKDGKQVRWKNLNKVWNYLNNRDKFYEYVKSEMEKYLKKP
ncbi:MAG: nitrophenyl compound nitroreductase subunit ArsF family protein [Thermodesulfobacteriota bacterium]|nr:nitrophenyl compound nitroreductase subunit ArsF family protein [Thermodesulfobacteriota bacterium]